MDKIDTTLNTARDELFRIQAAQAAQRFQQQFLARQTFRRVDLLIIAALALIGVLVAMACLVRVPRHHALHGVIRPAAEPLLVSLSAAGTANSRLVLRVVEGQQVAQGALLGAVVTDRDGEVATARAPVAGTVARIDWAEGHASAAAARITLEPLSPDYVARYELPPELGRFVSLHQKLPLAAEADARALSGEVVREWTAPGHGGQPEVLNIAVKILPDGQPLHLRNGAGITAVVDETRLPLIRMLMPGAAR
ncbi:hypothetical protein JOD97_000020 [Duganella sp. 1411]|jgi:hypothetical protein|uniref:DUF2118 domain-containing protein n=1 Tax=Duganella sp. 1411 TaxID=2806572 RepID=UPI001AE3A2F3|nr:DUF2118 domain-containing protein [Duganella sp. 1411]MBP1202006.1 hypothetical protein [Duganella sp. 1411]